MNKKNEKNFIKQKTHNYLSCNNYKSKMFCKVCKDAGKTDAEYTSHYVKDKSGNVTCPTLLNQACKYCKQTGHTVKFCKTLKLKEKNKRREEYFKKQHPEWQEELNSATRRLGSSFAAAFDSETEDESEDEPEDEYSTMKTVELDLNEKVPIATHYIRSYASVLVDDLVPQVEDAKVDTPSFTIDTSHLKGKFWGDEDSDSDEE